MGGLVIDIVIAYLIKSALRLRRLWGSNRWRLVQGRIDSSWRGGGWVWNCPTAEVAYTYEFAGQTYSAIDSKPFLIETSAQERVERYQRGKAATIRVSPMQPERSALKEVNE